MAIKFPELWPTIFAHPASAASKLKTNSANPIWLIIIFAGLLSIAVVIASGLFLSNLRDRTFASNEQTLSNTALIVTEQLEHTFTTVATVQNEIIKQTADFANLGENGFKRALSGHDFHVKLRDKASGMPYVGALTVFNAQGQLINFSRSWPIPEINVGDRDFFKALNSDPNLTSFVGEPVRNRATGTWVVHLARKISGPNSEFLGLTTAAIELQYFETFFNRIAARPGDGISLFRTDGTLFVRSPKIESDIGRRIPIVTALKLVSTTDHGVGKNTSPLDGQFRIIAARLVRSYPVLVSATRTVAAAFVDLKRMVVYVIAITVLMVIAIVTSALLIIRMLRNHHALTKARVEQENAEKYRTQGLVLDAALNNMSQGLAMFDSSERIILCNQRYVDMYELPPEAVAPGRSLRELLRYQQAQGNLSRDIEEYRLELLDGLARGETRSVTTTDAVGRSRRVIRVPMAGGGWVGTHEDVTEKLRAERVSEQQKIQLDIALENMRQGLLMCDASGRVILTNQKYLKMYGLSPNAVTPDWTIRDVLHQRKVAGTLAGDPDEYLAKRINHGKIEAKVVQIPDGRTISVTNAPVPGGGWVSTHEDISEGIRREESFRLLFERNPVPMWVVDRESLRFLSINDAAITHYGYSREQFMAMTVPDLRPDEDREHVIQSLQTESNYGLVKNILQHLKADGTTIEVCVYSQALVYAGHNARLVAIHDITQAKHSEEELRRTKIFLDTIVEHIPLPIIVKDVAGLETDAHGSRFTLFNRAYEDLTGESRIQLIGKTAHQLFPKERADLIVRADNETLQCQQAVTTSEHPIITSHNGTRLVTAKKTVVRDETGKPAYLVTVVDDVTERRRAEQRIAHMAHHDTLTNLPNRAAFGDTMDAMIDHARASGEQVAILSIDLDHFKEANDTYGHSVGDALLREVSSRLQGAAEGAFLARIGGDEFTLIVAGGEQPPAAEALTKRLLAAFVEDFKVEGHQLKLGLSIGVAIYPTDGEDAKSLMANADAALYRAKAEFRGAALFYEAQMGVRLRERNAMQEDLRSAIDRGELLLHYQPQMKMSGETIGFEALVRWQCPKRGLVSPGTFIPLAEESSLIIPVGEWVLWEACREAASWQKPLTIAVNISPIQFHNGDLPRLVHSILLETGLAPGRLELEVTENVMISDFSRAVSILNQLKSLGVRIAMDDFGTGYSSLSYLQSFRCDKIKIDRIFVHDLETNYHSRAIVRAVIGLGQSLSLPILAEGVETEAQHAHLVREGCDEVQGYLMGRPLPIVDYANLVGGQTLDQQQHAPVSYSGHRKRRAD
jgi:diguanylate cyclase (GGDEF)-like protein/PAS domain S-box-containing protein